MLRPGGVILLTTPTHEWGAVLRERLGLDLMTTRFRILRSKSESTITLPSLLHPREKLREMLERAGFIDIEIEDRSLPADTNPVSQDISSVCDSKKVALERLPVIHVIRARANTQP